MGKLHWQNVVAPPQNKTQYSNGKAVLAERCSAAAEPNTTIKWESAGTKAERCSAKTMPQRDWQNVVAPPQNKNTSIKWESAGLAERCSTINKYSI
jgi:hypothetical protein